MEKDTHGQKLSRRTFLRALGAAGGAGLLAACGGTLAPAGGGATSGPAGGGAARAPAAGGGTSAAAAGGAGEVNLLWSDTTNARAPLIADFEKATGIKVNQTIVEYNARLDKINPTIPGRGG